MKKLFALLLVNLPLFAQTIRPEAIAAHMRFLADDLLEGRAAATRGYDLAAEYLAAQYEAIGLEPGANGGYFQMVPFRRATAQSSSTVVIRDPSGSETVLRNFEDFLTQGDTLRTDARSSARVVFAGFGVTAPERKHDDYASIDARGKIVVVLSGAPSRFPSTLRAHHSSSHMKAVNAAAHGAAGLLTVGTREYEASSKWPRAVRNSKLGSLYWLVPGGTPHDVPALETAQVRLNHKAAEILFRGSKRTLQEVLDKADRDETESFEIPGTVDILLNNTHELVQSANVIGLLRGSDPVLRDEYLVYSSHLDHIGITDPVDGDSINNGAFDNASGIATMLEIARAFALGKRPRRSILFVSTTAEEKGLKGADYFANNPPVPADKIVANINIDQIVMLEPTRDLVVYGAEHSSLGAVAGRVGRKLKIELSPDPIPDETIFVRSDQYPFIKKGIPAVFIVAGYKPLDPKVNLVKAWREWSAARYHSPSDDMQQPMAFDVAVSLGRFAWMMGAEVANQTVRPKWNKGDFFGDKFGTTATR